MTLQRRALTELESQALVTAQTIAATIGREGMMDPAYVQDSLIPKFERQLGEGVRIIVVDLNGVLVADSAGDALIGTQYATPDRPELQAPLQRDARPDTRIRYSQDLNTEILATAVPIRDEEDVVGAVRLTESTEQVQANVRKVVPALVIIGLAPLAAGLVLAFALAGSLAKPLARLADAARRLGGGDLSVRAEDTKGAREIDELARSFDEMADRLERAVRAQREFVANASHQLRTPLTGMKLRLESAVDEAGSEDVRRQLQAADREVDRLAEIVDRLLVMARQIEFGEPATVDLGAAAGRALSRWSERGERLGAQLSVQGDRVLAQADPTDVDQILDNLIDNAMAYAPGPISIETGLRGGRAFLAVEDRGSGIPPEERARVTERFYRGGTAPAGGSGLGLAIVRELAEKWGGSVRVSDGAEGGARIEVGLAASDVPGNV